MHIKFKNLCNANKHVTMHISNAINQKFMILLPLLVCFSLSKSLILLISSMLLPLCPLSIVHVQILLLCLFFVSISPPLSSISIKGMPLLIQRVALRDRWLTLESSFFMYTTICWDDTTIALEITRVGSFDLDTNWWGASPYVIAWVIPFDNFELL